MRDPFAYHELVRVGPGASRRDLRGCIGYIAGKAYEDGGPVEGYGVYVFDTESVVFFDEAELEGTANLIDPATLALGSRVKVRTVDGRAVVVSADEKN